VAVKRSAQLYEAQARHQLARAIVADFAPGEEQAARAQLDQALSIVQALGIRAYEPHIHLERSRLAAAVGDEAEQDRELREAHRLFLEVGAYGRAEETASLVRRS
jgi:D-serine deaminase-like pyridoxal phosphate-dependent protein